MTDEKTVATELATREVAPTMALPDDSELDRMDRIANALAQSNVVPVAYRRKPHDILAAALAGRELGMSPMSALQRFFVVDGRPTLSAEGMISQVQKAGHEIWIDDERSNDKIAVAHAQRRGSQRVHTMTFTIEEARSAGLAGKDNWKKYPKAMLRARAISALCRVAFADVLAGYAYTPEEMGAVVDEEGTVIEVEAKPAKETPGDPSQPWYAGLLETYDEATILQAARNVAERHGVTAPVETLDNISGLNPSWQNMIGSEILLLTKDVSAPSDGDDNVEDAEVVVENPCPHCDAPCAPVEGPPKAPKWKCTSDTCEGNDEGNGPWVSWHNNPWKIDGQIEKEYGIPSPDRTDDNPMPESGGAGSSAASGEGDLHPPDDPEPRQKDSTGSGADQSAQSSLPVDQPEDAA